MEDSSVLNKDVPNICVRCKQPIKAGLKCTRCGRLTHKACVKLLKNAQVLDSGKIICCSDSPKVSESTDEIALEENDSNNELIKNSVDLYVMKVKYLEEINKQKDIVIMNQGIAISALTDQIAMLKQQLCNSNSSNTISQVKHQPKPSHSKSAVNAGAPSRNFAQVSAPKNSSAAAAPVTVQDVSNAIHNIEARRICNDAVNLLSDSKLDTPRRVRNSRSLLVGSGVDQVKCPFKAASSSSVKYKYFHATNFDVNVDEGELCNYLKTFAPNVAVHRLVSRNPTRYSSFKISVPQDEAEKIQVADIWPVNVVLNRFFPPNRFRNNR